MRPHVCNTGRKPLQVLAGATKAQRKAARKNIVLGELPETTVRRYNKAIGVFFNWLSWQDNEIECVHELDVLLARFIVHLWQEGR